MSAVVVAPGALAAATSELTGIGAALSQAHTTAAASTTGLVAAAEDEISAAVASLFSSYGQQFQALGAQTSVFHQQFAQALNGAGSAYSAAEAANASPLQALEQDVLGAINAPTSALFHRPLIGNGANGSAGTGQNGGPGGFLLGDGGNGGSGTSGSGAGGSGGAGGAAGLFGRGGAGGAGGAGATGFAGAPAALAAPVAPEPSTPPRRAAVPVAEAAARVFRAAPLLADRQATVVVPALAGVAAEAAMPRPAPRSVGAAPAATAARSRTPFLPQIPRAARPGTAGPTPRAARRTPCRMRSAPGRAACPASNAGTSPPSPVP